MAREFPRLWDTNFKFAGSSKVDTPVAGRMDIVALNVMGDPGMYHVLAAANGIRNVLTLRPTIRPVEEAIRTELELKGVPAARIAVEVAKIMENLDIGAGDWYGYESADSSGTITDVEPDAILGIPDMGSAMDFVAKYSGDEA